MEDPANILYWQEEDVHNFLCSLGFKGYEAQIKEHEINGEILVQCDHEALKDVGIHSVGQRLAILKAVYQLKLQYDVPIEEGHWVPPSEFIDQVMVDSPAGVIPPDRLFDLLRERDERIHSLEASLIRLSEQVNGMRDEVYGLNKALYTKEPPIPINKLRPNQASPTTTAFPRAHLRNGSAHVVGNDGSPAASPVHSPVRTTHEALHNATVSTSSVGDMTAAPTTLASTSTGGATAAGGLQHSSSLRRRANNYFGTSTAAHHNGLLSADGNATEVLPSSPGAAVSPLPLSSGSRNATNPSTEPPTPTATTYLQQQSASGSGQTSDSSAANSALNRSGVDGAIHIGSSGQHASASDAPSSQSQLQRPATAQAFSTSPGGTSLMLPNRPSTSASSEGLAKAAAVGSSTTSNTMDLSSALMTPSTATSSTSHAAGTSSSSAEKKGSSSSSSDNPYKSFRVTHEDPCYKVLPAALKKYKINDDWRQYALFICHDNQERCLSYDEKPLSIFQKLKDANKNPVFMLRHIKDIKSPIAGAQAKHAARREKRLREGKHVSGEGREGSIREFTRATRLHHPTNLQPVVRSPNSPNPASGSLGNADDDKDKDGKDDDDKHHGLGYALAIYPYMADRDDEFDVNVGDTFVILNKTKGWWVVHRDTTATKASDIVRSGWVPQGCLLETSVPPSRISSTPLSSATPINPLSIVSVSTPGLALMDYTAQGSDEITMKKGDKLRVFKRYNYWSYVIKESTGERGWTPSWFVGKLSSGNSATSTPTTALTAGASSSSPSNGGLRTPNPMTPLSAIPLGSARKEQTAGNTSSNSLNISTGDTTPTSATMVSS
ncbi:hypothetical protein P389DRAFT_29921 [Cystobasidium minutum MCA 4210]|uniref:uncharacterized protein n=1 Tax=Cystobasidium minutum MCA 4210 TaxID=1397322 RepID=UPI0034CDCBF8|eukprot:jgi/Rhomi1/29921/CE29920_1072